MPRTRIAELSIVLAAVAGCDGDVVSQFAAVWAGQAVSCATTVDGRFWCWGENSDMQVGDGTKINRSHPVPPQGQLHDVTFVSSGSGDTCAVQERNLFCWGARSGGDGGILSQEAAAVPTRQSVVPDPVVQVTTGAAVKCVLKADGGAWCWGRAIDGSLGDGANQDSAVPVPVSSMSSGVVSILTKPGQQATYALKDDGSVWGWGPIEGANLSAIPQVGAPEPVPIVGVDNIPLAGMTQIAGFAAWTCALSSDSRVLCWGGIPTMGFEPVQTDVAIEIDIGDISTPIEEIAVCYDSICRLDAAGNVECAGRNEFGQLGDDTRTDRFTMAPVRTLPKRAIHIVSGGAHACAILEDETLWCWGSNGAGELGVGDNVDRLHPTQVRFGD